MTKKPSEKNKTWEKDRRDRLNKSFDTLAKLLPKFDPSVTWSKIEVIVKSIAYIEEMQLKISEYLKTHDATALSDYKEFVETLKFYQTRNSQLCELLKKAKITIPAFELPKLLKKNPTLLQENVPAIIESNSKAFQKQAKYSNAIKAVEGAPKTKDASSKDANKSGGGAPSVPLPPTDITTARPGVLVPVNIISLQPNFGDAKKPMKKIAKSSDGHLKILPKPFVKIYYRNADGKVPIPMLKRKLPPKKVFKRKRKPNQTKSVRIESEAKKANVDEPKNGTISPTAAFLMAFPVVSSSSGRNVDSVDNFENLNNFFATKEYSTFCEESGAAKRAPKSKDDAVPKKISTLGIVPICTPLPLETKTGCGHEELRSFIKDETIFKVPEQPPPSSDKKSNLFQPNQPKVETATSLALIQPAGYYPPLSQSEAKTTNFSFNLTSTSSSATASVSTSKQFLTDLSWIPPPTTDYKSSFTFSLTPTTNTAPSEKPSKPIFETTNTFSFSLTNPKTSTGPSNAGSTTTNFTFALTKPADSQPVQSVLYDCDQYKQSRTAQKQHVNWMTSVPTQAFASTLDSATYYPDDNQFLNWTPNKTAPVADNNGYYNQKPVGQKKAKTYSQPNVNNNGNFLSVTQLVEPMATPSFNAELAKVKVKEQKPKLQELPFPPTGNQPKQVISNTYSAEALISKKEKHRNLASMHSSSHGYYNPSSASVSSTGTAFSNEQNYNNPCNGYFYNYPANQSFPHAEEYLDTAEPHAYPNPPSSNEYSKTKLFPSMATDAPNYFPVPLTLPANPPACDLFDSTQNAHQYYPHAHQTNTNYHQTNNWTSSTAAAAGRSSFNGNGQNNSHLYQNHATGSDVAQHQNLSGNLPNFNLSSICPEINDKNGNTW